MFAQEHKNTSKYMYIVASGPSPGEHSHRGTRSEQQLQLYFAGERKQRSFSFVNDENSSSPCIPTDLITGI